MGGLVSSVLPVLEKLGGVWVAWGDPAGCYPGSSRRSSFDLCYIDLTPDQIEGYYQGLANNALWPLCHYFLDRAHYNDAQWQTYEEVNRQFARATLEEARSDDVIWVHDYHLARVPYYVRREQPSMRIAFFWHIPFPFVEVFRTLPWRRPFLESLLACDWVGFHIPEYTKNFMGAVHDVLGADIEDEFVHYAGRTTRVLSRPIGIDDSAVERLMELKPELHGRVSLIQIITPSRMRVKAYRQRRLCPANSYFL